MIQITFWIPRPKTSETETNSLEQERYTDYSQKVIVKASVQSSDMQWRHICFSLARGESRWLIDDVGRAAL